MKGHRRWSALAVPAVVTAVMLAILLGLGTWQLQRRQWKLSILADVDRAEASAPIELPVNPQPFTKVVVHGVLRLDQHALYGSDVRDTAAGSVRGAQLIEPLDRDGQLPILIDRGWVPNGQLGQAAGGDVVGYVRTPDVPGTFTPADDPAARHFYTLDPAKIGAALGLPAVAPFTLVAMGDPAQLPQPATALPRPPNDHLNYALTWFGLALSLSIVFAAYCRKTLMARGPR